MRLGGIAWARARARGRRQCGVVRGARGGPPTAPYLPERGDAATHCWDDLRALTASPGMTTLMSRSAPWRHYGSGCPAPPHRLALSRAPGGPRLAVAVAALPITWPSAPRANEGPSALIGRRGAWRGGRAIWRGASSHPPSGLPRISTGISIESGGCNATQRNAPPAKPVSSSRCSRDRGGSPRPARRVTPSERHVTRGPRQPTT